MSAVKESKPERKVKHVNRMVDTGRLRYTPFGAETVEGRNGETRALSGSRSYGFPAATFAGDAGLATPISAAADLHVRDDLDKLRAQSQAFDRGNCIYQALMSRVCDVILGSGWTMQARTSSGRVNNQIEALWSEWWAAPEVRGMDDGTELCAYMLRHLLVDGDELLIKDPASGLVQFIPGERVNSLLSGVPLTPDQKAAGAARIESGVELDTLGKPIGFLVSDYTDYGYLSTKTSRKSAADVVYIANRLRHEQTRGVPAMEAAFPMLHRINDVCDSEAAAWQLLSRLAVAIYRKDAARISVATSRVDDTAEAPPEIASRYHDFGEAIIFHGEPGEEIKGIDRNIPGANFEQSIKMFMRLLGLPLGFTLEFMLLIWSDTNYSSGRASAKQVERNCRRWIGLLRKALIAIQNWKVRQWVQEGKLPNRADILKHEWNRPPYPFIDPQKEADAKRVQLEAGLTSPTRVIADGGDDFEELLGEQARDVTAILEVIREINTKYPEAKLSLSDFTAFVKPKTAAPATATRPAPADEPPEPDTPPTPETPGKPAPEVEEPE